MTTVRFTAPIRRTVSIAACAAVAVSIGLMPTGAGAVLPPVTAATAGTVYDNIPAPLPGNLPSEAFEAQTVSQFGGAITMTSASVVNPVVTVLMSSWGCQSGNWSLGNCSTTPGSTFSVPITLNIHKLGGAADGSPPGALVASVTNTFAIPYRPSADYVHCTGGTWYNAADATCYNGFATPIVFHVPATITPAQVVVSVAYNTTHYGSPPVGEGAACFTSPGGCGYDSLNVALSSPPSVGSDPRPNDAYMTAQPYGYCGNSSPAPGSFVLTTGCWTGYQPAIRIQSGSVSTVLKANPSIARVLPGLRIYLTLSATLTITAGNPVLGEPIVFTAAGHYVCTAVTNSAGNAGCSGLLTGVLSSVIGLGYYATFFGDGVLQARISHGPLIRVL